MSNDIESRLKTCFTTVFPDLPTDGLAQLSAAELADWDSLATVILVGVIEEEFDLEVRPEDAKQFLSFQSIASWLVEQTP